MGDVSNKTLVGLLVVAIVVSLAGTFVSLSKMSGLTGFNIYPNTTSQDGQASAEIEDLAQLTLVVQSLDFGVGVIDGNFTQTAELDFCHLLSQVETNSAAGNSFDAIVGINATPCYDFSIPDSLEIENTGNTDFAQLNISSEGGNTLAILGSSTAGNYSFRTSYDSGSTCGSTPTTAAEFGDPGENHTICNVFQETQDNDAIAVAIEFYLGDDAPSGQETDTIHFYGYV